MKVGGPVQRKIMSLGGCVDPADYGTIRAIQARTYCNGVQLCHAVFMPITRWTEFSAGWKGTIYGTYQGQAYESPCKIEF